MRDEIVKEGSVALDFVNSEPVREEQVENADSPSSVETAGISQDGQLKPSSNIQQQAYPQALQPSVSANTGVTTSLRTLSGFTFRWSHALIAVGLLVTSGAGTTILIKNSILPRLKSWIHVVVLEEDDLSKGKDSKPTLAEEAAQAAKAAAVAAADMAKASQEILASQSEDRRYYVEVVSLLDKQVQEMKLMTNAIRRLEVKSSSQPASAPHSKSYMEIMAMIQRGEKPSNIRVYQFCMAWYLYGKVLMQDILMIHHPTLISNHQKPRLVPRTKPWEVGQVQVNGKDFNSSVEDNGDIPAPWWQTKNVRTSEIDSGVEYNRTPNGAASGQ
ncbi:hypothetical protein TanjilG_00550 [Lupinus angustifolius]|uniref:Peroxisomal membrane protein PEX14 n=1 Tax=Lupinus angustifolius TaxID=3871 RepID=A0A4P1QXC8_LUPAN|nr:hypothetical protein TanjilG_00550 [Lupinus angustifolius]